MLDFLCECQDRMRQRWQLMMLDARALADIGIDRADAETECLFSARSKRLGARRHSRSAFGQQTLRFRRLIRAAECSQILRD